MTLKNIKNCLKVSLLTAGMLFFQQTKAQYDFTAFEKLLDKNKKEFGTDYVVMIAKDNKVVYKKETTDMKANTDAPLASISKWITAALVLQMVDEGRINLDDKVSTYLPIFVKYGKSYITIRHCLTHQTGIESDELSARQFEKSSKYENLEQEVNDFAAKKDIQTNPGTEFRYSNTGLTIAARVLEVVTKRQFDRLVLEKLLRPMGMKSAFQSDGLSAVSPSGGARMTAQDLMKFLQMIQNKGMYNGKRILSEQTIDEMLKPQITGSMIKYAPKTSTSYLYGLGVWILSSDANGKTTAVVYPGVYGTWTVVDFCRGYSCLILTKNIGTEKRKEMYSELKQAIDAAVGGNCE